MISAKEYIQEVIISGSPAEKRELFGFNFETPRKLIAKKFKLFSRGLYPRYFKKPSAPFHDEFVMDMILSYFGENRLQAAYRGSAKTSLKKLFDVFVLLNDADHYRKYIKVLTKDGKNSRQIVTDVYNLIVEAREVYGNPFEKEGDIKREETMGSFTTKTGVKYNAGTVGQTQRGHIQDAYRPDWIWFEDIEDRESIRSAVITQGIIDACSEAIDGLSKDGSYYVTCNYISDQGAIQWFMNKPSVSSRITPLLKVATDFTSATWSIYTPQNVESIKADADDFWGEYMCDPKRSENKFFDITRIEADMLKSTPPIRESAGVKYWSNYQPNHRYGQGSDHSEGVGLDSNTLIGFDFTTGEQVYSYANNQIAPDISAHEFARVGAEYGNCIYAPEINTNCGGIVITTLKSIPYPNIYRQTIEDKATRKMTEKLGFSTNSSTKYTAFYEFRTDYNSGLIKIHDINLLKEMKAYTNKDLNENQAGLVTRHFDLLMAAVIGWQMRKYADLERKASIKSYRAGYDKYLESLKM